MDEQLAEPWWQEELKNTGWLHCAAFGLRLPPLRDSMNP
jgi:hypothetical protein